MQSALIKIDAAKGWVGRPPVLAIERRLAAIMAVDVVGYSRLMEADEGRTLVALKKLHTEIVAPLVSEHRGRIVKQMGDGSIVEFGSAVAAVSCAVELQQHTTAHQTDTPSEYRIVFRIGINLGEVLVEGSDLLGHGVNVAARLQELADPGGIYISEAVRGQLRGKTSEVFEEAGERTLKNIARPVRVFRWAGAVTPASPVGSKLPDKPSIAVLPFINMNTDLEHEFFADGLALDLITLLSRNPGLFVIARNSTFTNRAKSMDVREVARDFGVRYVLQGSARRAAGRVCINVQLVDATSGENLWGERFDRTLEDVFAVQDEVTRKIVKALVGRLATHAPRKRPASLEAYDLCIRSRALTEELPQTAREAHLVLKRAIEIDPLYAEARSLLAYNRWLAWTHFGEPEQPNRKFAVELAKEAVGLDPNDAGCRYVLGTILAYEKRWKESDAEFRTALTIDPNHADTWAARSDMSILSGRVAEGLEHIQKALRLNPCPPSWYFLHLGQAQYAAQDYEAAVETLRREETYRTNSRRFLAAGLAQLGLLDEARREVEMFLVAHPHFTIRHWVNSQPVRDLITRDHVVEGFRKAGLPE